MNSYMKCSELKQKQNSTIDLSGKKIIFDERFSLTAAELEEIMGDS
jgi:hypothetical protein